MMWTTSSYLHCGLDRDSPILFWIKWSAFLGFLWSLYMETGSDWRYQGVQILLVLLMGSSAQHRTSELPQTFGQVSDVTRTRV